MKVAEGPTISLADLVLARLGRRRLPTPLGLVIQAAAAGDVAVWRMGPRRLYQVNAPALVSEVLVERADEFPRTEHLSRALAPVFGRGLLIADGEIHRSERRRLFAAFSPQAMAAQLGAVVDLTGRWLDGLRPGQELDIEAELQRVTLVIGARVMMGAAAESDSDLAQLGGLIAALQPHCQKAVSSLVHLPAWAPTPGFRRRRALVAQVDDSLSRIASGRRAPGTPPDALDLLRADRGADQQLVRDGMFSLLTAAQEGTTATLSFMLYLLARHQAAAAALATEVDEVLGGREPTYQQLESFSTMDQQLKETWRLYPPSWITTRSPLQDTTLGSYRIPRGAMLAVSPYALHRDARRFADPERFLPSRWTSEFEGGLARGAWLPFGAGPHSCIGRTLGWLEARVILAMLVQRFRIELVGDGPLALSAGITLRPRRLRLRLQPRG